MNNRNFMEMAGEQWADKKFVCVGLDSDQEKIPNLKGIFKEDVLIYVLLFNTAIIEATRDIAGFYKPNVAFYESMGDLGAEVLKNTITHIHDQAPHVPVILDAKRGDIGKTNDHYVKAAFDYFKADAVTIHPYLGKTGMLPFLNQKNKGIIVLSRTSNPDAGEFQDLIVEDQESGEKIPFYRKVARNVARSWNENGNCMVVAGATYPEELQKVRKDVGEMGILIPGIGKQGGDLEKTVNAGKNSKKEGMIINSSSGIIFAARNEKFAEAARKETERLDNQIKTILAE